MNVTDELKNIDLNSPIGQIISNSKEYSSFNNDSEFIQDTLDVLESDNLAHKKNYFIDNQVYVTDSLNNLHQLLQLLEDNVKDPNDNANLTRLLQVVGITIKKLERGIDRFQQELTGQISSQTVNEKISISEDTIKEAMQNNESTMQMVEDLKNPNEATVDARTAEIQKSFAELTKQKHMVQQSQKKQNLLQGYMIASQDLSNFRIIQGNNISKDALNELIERSGIDNARIFRLNEMPTKQKTIQKVVTVVG